MNVRFRLKTKDKVKKNLIILEWYSKEDKRYFKRSTYLYTYHQDWNIKKERSYSDKLLNKSLDLLEESLAEAVMYLNSKGLVVNLNNIKSTLEVVKLQRKTTSFIISEFLNRTSITKSSSKEYKTSFNLLKSFNHSFEIKDNYNRVFVDSYSEWLLLNRGLNNTTIYNHLTNLNSLVNYSNKKGYSNINTISVNIKKDSKTTIVLSEEEIKLFYSYSNLTVKQKTIRDYFILLCTTSLRFSDLKLINKNNVSDETLKLNSQKTNTDVVIPLNKISRAIITDHNYTFDIDYTLSYFNRVIRDIAKRSGISDSVEVVKFINGVKYYSVVPKYSLLGSHTGRRSFITHLINKGISHQIIMKVSGHSSYTSFAKYVRLTSNDINKAICSVF